MLGTRYYLLSKSYVIAGSIESRIRSPSIVIPANFVFFDFAMRVMKFAARYL